MKALTILQPFAELIVADANTLPPHQFPTRIENRNWPTDFRGDFLIHAGKSQNWLVALDWPTREYPLPLGALVGIATLVDCVSIDAMRDPSDPIHEKHPWLAAHQHAVGRWCFVLTNVRRFVTPITTNGQLGWWNVPDELIASARTKETQ